MNTRTRQATAVIALVAVTALSVAGCADVAPPASTTPPGAASPVLPTGDQPVTLDPSSFTTDIDNPYWPMTPGTRWTYREVDGAGETLTVTVIVTSDTKEIANGVTARVVRDTVRRGEVIVEDTIDWYAQDADGAIWYLGEDTAEFDNGTLTSRAGSFEAGVNGALPGIAVPAEPAPGLKYRQEYLAGEAEDNGEVLSTTAMAQTPAGHFDQVLMTWDTITIEPDVGQVKFYAPGVGPVLTLSVAGGGGGREELITTDTVPDGTGLGPLGNPQ